MSGQCRPRGEISGLETVLGAVSNRVSFSFLFFACQASAGGIPETSFTQSWAVFYGILMGNHGGGADSHVSDRIQPELPGFNPVKARDSLRAWFARIARFRNSEPPKNLPECGICTEHKNPMTKIQARGFAPPVIPNAFCALVVEIQWHIAESLTRLKSGQARKSVTKMIAPTMAAAIDRASTPPLAISRARSIFGSY